MENRKISSWLWLSLLLASFCVSIRATVRNPHTLSETLPAYAITDHLNLLNASRCRTELEEFRAAVDRGVLWSLRMLDASGKEPTGFINGNNLWVGDRLQCNFLDAKAESPISWKVQRNNSLYRNAKEEYAPYNLHFFLANIRHNSTLQYHIEVQIEDLIALGLCLPASCTKNEVATLVDGMCRDRNLLFGQLYSAGLSLINVSELRDDHQWLLRGDIIIIILALVLLFGMVIVGTVYDIMVYQKRLQKKQELLAYENNNTSEMKNDMEEKHELNHEETAISNLKPENRVEQILVCFSFYTNVIQLFNTSGASDGLPMFHGMRFLGMVWIIMVHTLFYSQVVLGNKITGIMLTDNFISQILSNATLSVDTYFFISGFLLTYIFLKAQQKEKKAKRLKVKVEEFFKSIVKRFIRLTPAYAVVIMISLLNFTWYEKTSLYTPYDQIHTLCSKYWWRNILYISNFFDWDELCLNWSWYLSNDMQFFIVGSFLLILSLTHYKTAVTLGILSLLVSIVTSGYDAYILEYVPTLDMQYATLKYLYMKPWTRISPYLIGMATCQLLTKWNYKLHLSTKALVACWSLAILCNCSILFGLVEKNISLGLSVFYTAFNRTGWGLGIGWLIVACCTNNAGVVNKFLSLKMWVPLGRLTYCSYLLNPFLVSSVSMYSNYALHIDILTIGCIFLGILVASYASATLLSAIAEVPFIQLLRIITNSQRRIK